MIIFRVLHLFSVRAKNYYAILDLKPSATQNDIKRKYYQLAKFYHPDSGKHVSDDKFKEITEAYNILKDPIKRKQYDLNIRKDQQQFKYTKTSQANNSQNYKNYYHPNQKNNKYEEKQENIYQDQLRKRKENLRKGYNGYNGDINRMLLTIIIFGGLGITCELIMQIYKYKVIYRKRSYPQKLNPQDC